MFRISPAFFVFIAALLGCSPDTLTGRVFHNTTAHYNGYFYAREEIKNIEKTLWQNHQDDYSGILWLFPSMDSVRAKAYDKQIQEAVKMASIAIQRHPGSKWTDDSYLLVGKARLYSFDWGNAIQTFKYINNPKVTRDANMRHTALIWLLRTYAVHREFSNAEAVIDYLQKENLNRANKKRFLLEKAYYFQLRGNFDGMIRALSEVEPLFSRKDKPGRYYFIMGQVYQHLGFESEAYNFYRKTIGVHPAYEIEFYARLYMTQVAEISRSRDIAMARKSFRKLLTDAKNRDFKDKIYYEMGLFEEKQGHLSEAIQYYNLALRQGNNRLIDADAYQRLGHLYYDSLRSFVLAQAYYDSAARAMPPSRPGYAEIKKRQEILGEFVKHYKIIQLNDSLLTLSRLDTASLRRLVEEKLSHEPPVPLDKKQKVKRKSTDQPVSVDFPAETVASVSGWYFSNPSTLAAGRTEFLRVWGRIALEDNWRKTSARSPVQPEQPVVTAQPVSDNKLNAGELSAEDRVNETLRNLMAQIPYTDTLKQLALKRIEESLFALGDIYYFRMNEMANAVTTYQTLLHRFPASAFEAEVLYKLYLILKDTDTASASGYARRLVSTYPESTFARLLQNPDYLAETERIQEKQKILYRRAYQLYQLNELKDASMLIQEALQMEETPFVPWLRMLDILITGKSGDKETYQSRLQYFIENGESGELAELAQSMLQAAKATRKSPEKSSYSRQVEEPHYFVAVVQADEALEANVIRMLNDFNKNNFAALQLKVSRTEFNEKTTFILVSDLPRISTAIEYYRTFGEKLTGPLPQSNGKFSTFVISKGNFNILYRTQQLHEYLEFFAQVYQIESP
ncbi:MAG: hypothetical protein KatS3mg032_2079 [Cyclobacteriaceae bacterium]|nr:MAG: hypothetical protein KatS3mg032_2079 [Cyclobacteriaceae bacterium]